MAHGHILSCGCYRKEAIKRASTTHGMSHTKEYRNYRDRKRRDFEKTHDVEWTLEMEIAIRKFFRECVVCGNKNRLEVDHVLPLAKGNGLRPGNATILCHYHNQSKKDKSLDQLDDTTRDRIVSSAELFREYWDSAHMESQNSYRVISSAPYPPFAKLSPV